MRAAALSRFAAILARHEDHGWERPRRGEPQPSGASRCRKEKVMIGTASRLTLKKASLWIAGAALIPLAVGASTNLQTTIAENGAPISIDECLAVVRPAPGGNAGYDLSESIDFTNFSRQTATNVRFAFEIVDPIGRTERTLTGDEPGRFSPGAVISHSTAQPADRGDMSQLIGALPNIAKIVCRVLMIRFDDGSVWSEGDGPPGNAVMYTPLPGPSPTAQWQWPYDEPTPSGRGG
jgi:hypothetical protein